MRILAYSVRPDERPHLEGCAHEFGVELECVESDPTVADAHLARGHDGVTFLGQGLIDQELLSCWSTAGVRYLTTRTIGFDHIDIEAAHKLGLRVAHSNYPPASVAEFTVMLMLIVLRKYKPALWRQQVNDYSLAGLCGRDLGSMTVGVIGCGRIGRSVAHIVRGFGAHVLGYDPGAASGDPSIEFVPLGDLYARSDVITLHMPLTSETHHMIDAQTIISLKDGVAIINCARGALCDTDAIIEGIESGKIGAFGADVMEGEEGIAHIDHGTEVISNQQMAYLRQFPNVCLTQHMAFYTETDVRAMACDGIRSIVEMASGRVCSNEL